MRDSAVFPGSHVNHKPAYVEDASLGDVMVGSAKQRNCFFFLFPSATLWFKQNRLICVA